MASAAERFKLIYCGYDKIFFEINWYGTIIAPNAEIVLGQTRDKALVGQFYADKIVVHQYSYLSNVPFNSEHGQLEYVFNNETIDAKRVGR